MRASIIIYPGINRDKDMADALQSVNIKTTFVDCQDTAIASPCDLIVLPGGFSYGDYLRPGALAAVTPIMQAVRHHASRGGYILGICNGFQILTESGLLPGFLMRNASLKFICKWVHLNIHNIHTDYTNTLTNMCKLSIPISNMEGNYQCSDEVLKQLHDQERIPFTYKTNPNGSRDNIAGILSQNKRILGAMPHFENAALEHQHNQDGLFLFNALAKI